MMDKALIVMAKRPYPGQTKTRLSLNLSLIDAAELYECFLYDVLALASSLDHIDLIIAYAPAEESAEAYFRNLAPEYLHLPQIGRTLGERLNHVLTQGLLMGYQQVVAVNSDSPTLPRTYLEQAFNLLADPNTDLVLGPCEDGGYYLIGWKRPHSRLVREVQMSTDHVLQDTLAIAAEENLAVSLLPSWYDVDEPEELARLISAMAAEEESADHTFCFLRTKMGRGR